MIENVSDRAHKHAGNYYVVKQILGKGLQADEECMNYTMTLMDKLEQAKVEAPGNDAIVDDIAAKAYMEQFAVETFQRADDAIHTNKASKYCLTHAIFEVMSLILNPDKQ